MARYRDRMARRLIAKTLALVVLAAGVVLGMAADFPRTVPHKIEFRFDGVNWHDATDDVESQTIELSYGRPDERGRCQAAEIGLVLNNNSGQYTPDRALSPHYPDIELNVEMRYSVFWSGQWHVRFHGEVSEWDPTWPYGDLSGDDPDLEPGEARVKVVASGMLRRLGQGKSALRWPMWRVGTRLNDGIEPHAYWAMMDQAGSTAFAYSLPNRVVPMIPRNNVAAVTFADDDTMLGSGPVATFGNGAGAVAPIPAYDDRGKWAYQLAVRIDDGATVIRTSTASPSGPRVDVTLNTTTDQVSVEVYDSAEGTGSIIHSGSGSLDSSTVLAGWVSVTLMSEADSSGSTDRVTANVRNAQGTLLGTATTLADDDTHARITEIYPLPFQTGASGGVGHSLVYVDPAFTLGTHDLPHARAIDGWAGEPAGERFGRLCGEEGIQFTIVGPASDTLPMGPQKRDTLFNLLFACADVDMGILCEARGFLGLIYRTLRSLYNQVVALELDAAKNEIVNPFAPTFDDHVRNKIAVERVDGGESEVVRESGPKSILPPPDGVGVYDEKLTLNVATDAQTLQNASWRRGVGTWPGMRYPAISPATNVVPGLFDEWLPLSLGDRMQVINLPPQHPAAAVDMLLQGAVETYRPTGIEVQANCSPAGPYSQVLFYGPWPAVIHEASGTTGSWSVTAPPGDLEDAVILLLHGCDIGGTADMGTPTGGAAWQLLHEAEGLGDDPGSPEDGAVRLWWKVGGDSEPSSYGLTQDASADGVAIVAAIRGVTAADLSSDAVVSPTGSGDLVPTPALTMPPPAGLNLRLGMIPDELDFAAPDGYQQLAGESGTPFVSAAMAARIDEAGDTGAADFTVPVSPADLERFGATVLLRNPPGFSRWGTPGTVIAEGMFLPDGSGNYASAPDAPALDITGDIELAGEATTQWGRDITTMLAKYRPTGDQRSFYLEVNADTGGASDRLVALAWSTDGTSAGTTVVNSTTPVPAGWYRLAIGARLDVDDGGGNHVVIFYYQTGDDIDLDAPFEDWTQLGAPVPTAGATSIHSGSGVLEAGSRQDGIHLWEGLLHGVRVRNGIGGATAADPDFDAQLPGTSSFDDSAGNTWTLQGSAQTFGGSFTAGTDTTAYLQIIPGYEWSTDLADYPRDLNISLRARGGRGAIVRATQMAAPVGPVQACTVEKATVNGYGGIIPAKRQVQLAQLAYWGH